MSKSLEIEICGVKFKNPIITASGTFGYGIEYARFIDLNRLGGISVKGISLKETKGNKMPRIMETNAGMLNAIGLQNVGVERFINEKLPLLKKYDTRIIVNFWGKSIEEYVEVARILDESEIDMLEMNISCPNIKEGGIAFGTDPKMTYSVVYETKKVIKNKPLIVKLSPNVTDIKLFGKVAEEAGADAISAINTLLGMAINIETQKPYISNITGGLSGPAIKPVAIRMVYELYKTISIPIIGIGGIMNYKDVVEFYLAGASAVQIGTANFVNPEISIQIVKELEDYLKSKSIDKITDLTGKVIV
ncbi:dihydroorotate dehydrogenase [Deferribacterales bacterium Es71-Z0220]|jgi:dihydroorotate dehydrogenase (NAD+) catalytic subunit|uniref:dihydroorotate dehydrogenase n=1 Tax=Deferrivibrio essentukiensis TaxID=2880922 RepID=UPI001F5FF658|nr:dihydroorotate dehydrogenase [Deferrivibrio essentukiensis]MBZ4671990.1 dihydroorotate oxidase catalytic subunit [Deferribacteraceae bacterium]MCB4204140.1 dihydroorotate dehydrogenase [Deferrivibrio essentukiensis]